MKTIYVVVGNFEGDTSDDFYTCDTYEEALLKVEATTYGCDWFSIEKRFVKTK